MRNPASSILLLLAGLTLLTAAVEPNLADFKEKLQFAKDMGPAQMDDDAPPGRTAGDVMDALGGEEMDNMIAEVSANMRQLVTESDVVLFSRSDSGACRRVKKALREMDVKYFGLEINQIAGERVMHRVLKEEFGMETVPVLFVRGEKVGGEAEVMELKKNMKWQEKMGSVEKLNTWFQQDGDEL
mmetsp:Transcript_27225/g.68296  ORF Transcript_27225/g.68296 Transcript_27225/m.68296 type:complete len:185 (+) Transcript_27225:182-736(+)